MTGQRGLNIVPGVQPPPVAAPRPLGPPPSYDDGPPDPQRKAMLETAAENRQMLALATALNEVKAERAAAIRERDEALAEANTLLAVLDAAMPLVTHAKQSTAPRTATFALLIAAVDEWQHTHPTE